MRIIKSESIYTKPHICIFILSVECNCSVKRCRKWHFPYRILDLAGFWATILFFSLVPSCPHPPAENIWWSDLNFLSLTPFSLWDEQSNRRTHNYVIEVQNSHLDFILRFAIFVRNRELCVSALCSFKNWATINLLLNKLRQFASSWERRMSLAVLVKVEDKNEELTLPLF